MAKVAILGGGAAGLAAAWRLSDPEAAGSFERITVYQRGWRLGGKGASGRGAHGRIEEHGLHVWLGYYDNAFRLMREVYAELDRPSKDPNSPIKTWRDGFEMSDTVGLQDHRHGDWNHWVAHFSRNDELPGDPYIDTSPLTPYHFVTRSLILLRDYYTAIAESGSVTLSTSPEPPSNAALSTGLAALAGAVAAAERILSILDDESEPVRRLLPDTLAERIDSILFYSKRALRSLTETSVPAARVYELADLVITAARGILADGLLVDPNGFAAVNDEEYRDWMRRHGADEETLRSPLVNGVYDLVFGYQDGDPRQPRFAAGTGLFLSAKLFYDYKGSIFWKMTAGMGDVMFAPLYQALRDRGVEFRFFTRIDDLELGVDQRRVERIHVTRQASLRPGLEAYEPLIDVGGLACFPSAPRFEQLDDADHLTRTDLETVWAEDPGCGTETLLRDRDFDAIVFAIPVGMIPYVAPRLAEADARWRRMAERIGTVATQAFQVWLTPPADELGWPHRGSTMTGYAKPYDTYASMDHLLPLEDWTGEGAPRSIGYFCSTMAAGPPPPPEDTEYPSRMRKLARDQAIHYLRRRAGHYWPGAVDGRGEFQWGMLAGAGDEKGEDRFDSQYWTANVDPSERYVQSLPGTDKYRLRADDSGFDGMVLAGDWIDSGLNAGCVEAAVISGLQAANALLGRPLDHRVSGYHIGPRR